ncbi:hypothetical protein JAAARDRAFT_206682 [Jaapia argillacea MUCL 33604]|uniref:Protein CPL1-like domain-containing protein n=1 Tax=Jaapia argillacea MUCL 33604 TaxID=933084 RepID=A0A067PT13_9AGAM|nr:hypothetical protein JAAARDRAFT_206682 [Jaapia argillacea MUCL 33604]
MRYSRVFTVAALVSLVRGATIDICGIVDGPFAVKGAVIGFLDLCLCEGQASPLVNGGSNPVLSAAVTLAGTGVTTAQLTSLIRILAIRSAPGNLEFSFPEHSIKQCTADNPCGHVCASGYTACKGGCIFGGCPTDVRVKRNVPSGGPTKRTPPSGAPPKRDVRKSAKLLCQPGWSACKPPGGSTHVWECIDTQTDLESCGGCPESLDLSGTPGVDCSALRGVHDVSCLHGTCVVHRCKPGYRASSSGTSCVKTKGPSPLEKQHGFW